MPLTILVADDDPGTRLSISDYLELSGYLVVSAEDGRKALAMVDQYQPHLIVTDITMPQMDGYELVRQVRRQPAFRLLPVIFLTARTNTQERILGYQLGCDAYLPKPFDLEELGAVIRNLLERVQMIQLDWRMRPPTTEAESPHLPNEQPKSSAIAIALDLTPREWEVLDLLTDGLSNSQIGDRLHLSSRTVEKYVSSLLRKTETNNRAELVRFAMEHHLVE
ncbi:response regulator transcription factor [Oculatella sp. FACHB-28]|uniref:response regulator transcription factor n=1 Tax=Cyanophyceae TaxID=3028117 RepID=UPI0016893960|nr:MULTISPECIES: response regulator transcription factor [Cyanophyceae]MBD1871064.1 response regulator transcription factor [Cyanobacteria bacterium FACHB-471]MBD2001241.1 response regulator transcription factor [Leptolyngbya sp. FACHB-541]MBD2056400.1 response regulator transcription factor [Oculatella sp. FACHB-28]MBD2070754.1 response regulator transcription factor [Leptolyngbya sp. FACHB-671]